MKKHKCSESGVALIAVLLVMLVMTVMMLGFYYVTTGEQRIAASDRDSAVAYYGAIGALEKMSSDLAQWFVNHTSPTPAQITALTTRLPSYPATTGITITPANYTIACRAPVTLVYTTPCSAVGGSLVSPAGTIGGNGPLAGLQGMITDFQLTVVADGPNNTEVKMTRTVQEVAVPVFQFGIFSDSDLSFFAGPNFFFGGRVHTNGNLFLAEDGGTLTLNDRTTAFKDVIREQLSNGFVTGTSYGTSVDQTIGASGGCPTPTCPACPTSSCRALALTEGSVSAGPGSAVNPGWTTLSKTTYNGWILNGATGAKKLNLALALAGGSPIAMIQRPPTSPPNLFEDPAGALGSARFENQASLRILLSDQTSSIMNLPGIDSTVAPYPLAENGSSGWPATIQRTTPTSANYLPPVDDCHPPMAESKGYTTDPDYMSATGTTLLGGYIKIEMQLAATPGTWQDVTKEILSLGISRDIATAKMAGATLTTASGGSLASSITYFYVVTALGAWGESGGTERNKATSSTNKTINLTWTAFPGATGYRVHRGTSAGGETGYISVGAVTSYSDTGGTALTAGSVPTPCTNNSIIHLEEAGPGVSLTPTNVGDAKNYVPINMYDAREGEVRDDSTPTFPSQNGILNLVEIDVGKLQQWFAGNIGSSGTLAITNSLGYILYTSDRRTNCTGAASTESACSPADSVAIPAAPTPNPNPPGEYANEDIINPSSTAGTPNGVLDAPEDVDGDGVFRTYGATPHPISICPVSTCAGSPWPAFVSAMPATNPAFQRFTTASHGNLQAEKNSVLIFRRALRLVNGSLGNLPPLAAARAAACSGGTAGGFTVTSENPIYILGDYNASVAAGFGDTAPLCHVPAAVMGDAVTLLSNAWTPGAKAGSGDDNSFVFPAQRGSRPASSTWYRTAILGGKNLSFPQPTWGNKDAGTDGGTHNFLRYDEDWGTSTLNYLGSMASFYFARQDTGIYKCCAVVYNPPTRAYAFDTDFQNMAKLPPGTPRFTDVNALSYYQAVLSTE